MMKIRDVGPVTKQRAAVREAETGDLFFERLREAAVTGDEQLQVRLLRIKRRERVDEDVEALLRFEPSNRPDDETGSIDTQPASECVLTRTIPTERLGIDAV